MTESRDQARVSKEDRARMARQVQHLRLAESSDDGASEWRNQVVEEANHFRRRHGMPELKTEPELHRYARALGLIGR